MTRIINRRIGVLTVAECRELLEEHHFGRLAFIDAVGVLPVAWHPSANPRYVRVKPSQVIGRRIAIGDLPPNWWG